MKTKTPEITFRVPFVDLNLQYKNHREAFEKALIDTAASGDITQNIALAVTGTSSFTVSSTGVITLTNSSNDFSSAITLSSGTGLVQVTGTNTITLAASTLGGALTVKADNDIKVQGDVTSDGNFTAVADNDSSGAGSFIVDSGVTVTSSSGNIDVSGAQIEENGTLTTSTSGTITKNGVLTQLTESDQSDVDSATNSSFVQDFTSPAGSGC